MAAITGDSNFGVKLVEVLGLDGHLVQGITLIVMAGEIVRAEVTILQT